MQILTLRKPHLIVDGYDGDGSVYRSRADHASRDGNTRRGSKSNESVDGHVCTLGSVQIVGLNLANTALPAVWIHQVQRAISGSNYDNVSGRAEETQSNLMHMREAVMSESNQAATHTAGALNAATCCGALEF
jgi:hypothetical protein